MKFYKFHDRSSRMIFAFSLPQWSHCYSLKQIKHTLALAPPSVWKVLPQTWLTPSSPWVFIKWHLLNKTYPDLVKIGTILLTSCIPNLFILYFFLFLPKHLSPFKVKNSLTYFLCMLFILFLPFYNIRAMRVEHIYFIHWYFTCLEQCLTQ